MTADSLLIRADASIAIGTGHVMRCLALAQAWQDAGGRAVFAMAEGSPAVRTRLESESCNVLPISSRAGGPEDAQETIELAREQRADWVAVDGYQFADDYQQALKAASLKVLFLDDYGHARQYSADFVLNQNVSADEAFYRNREPQTRLLLGPRYALLRREFAKWRVWKRDVPPECRNLLVTMGGSDPENLTATVIDAAVMAGHKDVKVTVVVGGSNPHLTAVQRAADRSGLKVEVLENISNMAELMAGADVIVSAAGSICWEICLLALPALLVDVADNQAQLARELDRRGCAVHVGDKMVPIEKIAGELTQLLNSHERRQSLSQNARKLVDGNGARRVGSVLRGEGGTWLRRARAEDSRLLWEWANDPDVRSASFSSDPIPWETHLAWFAGKLSRDESFLWIAEDEEGTPWGQIRFDVRSANDWEVDVSVASARRGRGLASGLIRLGVQALLKENPSVRVHALVKPTNAASVKVFERADFKPAGVDLIRGHDAIHLIYERN